MASFSVWSGEVWAKLKLTQVKPAKGGTSSATSSAVFTSFLILSPRHMTLGGTNLMLQRVLFAACRIDPDQVTRIRQQSGNAHFIFAYTA
jgi:hypothetical protein